MDKELFLNLYAAPPAVEAVETPQGTVYIRVMSAGEKDRFETEHAQSSGRDFRARVVVATYCDEQGMLLFAPKDIPRISALPFYALDPIVKAAIRLNAMSEEAQEDLEKKSEDSDDSSGRREPLDSPRVNSRPPSRALS